MTFNPYSTTPDPTTNESPYDYYMRTGTPMSSPAVQQSGKPSSASTTNSADPADPNSPDAVIAWINDQVSKAQYTAISGYGAQALGQQIGAKLAQLPSNIAQKWLNDQAKGALKGSPLLSSITSAAQNYGAPTPATTANKPIWDPLALQTMWHDVFGPAMQQAEGMTNATGANYLSAMKDAIAGSNASPQQQQAMLARAQAQSNLLQNNATAQTKAGIAQIPFDTLIYNLQQGAGAASLAQGEAQKQIAYGQAA